MKNKVCTMCGVEKSVDQFREYPREGRYPYCLDCQSIETRRRYLTQKSVISLDEEEELQQINKLYEMRLAKGLRTFGDRSRKSAKSIVDKQLALLEEM